MGIVKSKRNTIDVMSCGGALIECVHESRINLQALLVTDYVDSFVLVLEFFPCPFSRTFERATNAFAVSWWCCLFSPKLNVQLYTHLPSESLEERRSVSIGLVTLRSSL